MRPITEAEFKNLCHDVAQAAPQIKLRHKTLFSERVAVWNKLYYDLYYRLELGDTPFLPEVNNAAPAETDKLYKQAVSRLLDGRMRKKFNCQSILDEFVQQAGIKYHSGRLR